MPFKPKEREYRSFAVELEIPEAQEKKIETDYYVEGYALKYAPYPFYVDDKGETIYEEFKREAFNDCDMTDVIFQYNHEGRVFARNRNGSLLLWFDDIGLKVAADLSLTSSSRALYEDIKSGLSDQMSFCFKYGDVSYDKETRTIIHKSVKKIYDVSAVSIPANATTELYARQFADGLIGQVKEELEKRERQRKKLKLKIEMENLNHENT